MQTCSWHNFEYNHKATCLPDLQLSPTSDLYRGQVKIHGRLGNTISLQLTQHAAALQPNDYFVLENANVNGVSGTFLRLIKALDRDVSRIHVGEEGLNK